MRTRGQEGGMRAMWTKATTIALIMVAWRLVLSNVGQAAGPMTSLSEPVKTRSGLGTGELVEGGVRAYKGIPFAAPPIGELRWKPPQPVGPWQGVRRAANYGPACLQPDMGELTFRRFREMSEDCLYLNVWTPARSAEERLPVMVWMHGGGFIVDSASDDFYSGQDLARRGVVVVNTNYRLGPFGFLAHPLLSKESPHGVSGNYGLLDQIAALEWIRDNIAAFGGDPNRVTIFGQSGGGRSVAFLLVSPLARGLFHRAIIQSSTAFRPIQHLRESWYGRPPMEIVGERLAQQLRVDRASNPLAALRAISGKEILAAAKPALPGLIASASKGTPFEPIVDGWVLPDDPGDLLTAGKQERVPLLVGNNADEESLFFQKVKFRNLEIARRVIRSAFPGHGEEILRSFPFNTSEEAREAVNRIWGDMASTAPIRSTARAMEKAGKKVWLYHYTYARSDAMGRRLGAYHGAELRFVFNSLDRARERPTERDRRLTDMMSAFWTRFAATEDPNAPGLPEWPAYDRNAENYLEFGERVQVKQHLWKTSCDLFERIEAEDRAKRRQALQ